MPQATPKLRQRWGIAPEKAMNFLEKRGFKLTKEWDWIVPHEPDEKEESAIMFLIQEWDFGGPVDGHEKGDL